MQTNRKKTQWRVYKPNKGSSGAASRLEMKVVEDERTGANGPFTVRDVQLFWVASPQTGTDSNGNASFSWSQKEDNKSVTLKLGETDVGEVLAVLNNEKEEAGQTGGKFSGIYHQNSKGSTTFSFKKSVGKGYYIRLAKKTKSGVLSEVKHTLSLGEAQILRVILERAVIEKYQW